MVANRGVKSCRIAPRKNAKSTFATMAYPLREALEGRERYILILSDALKKNAIPFLRDNIKLELENNASLKAAYPDACGPGPLWQEEKIVLKNGVCIEVSSTNENIRGRLYNGQPPSLVIGDDLQGDKDISSATYRENSWRWFTNDVMNVGNPATNYLVMGTAIHRDAIVYKLRGTPGWDTKLWRALGGEQTRHGDGFNYAEHLKRPDLWDEWTAILQSFDEDALAKARAFYDANQEAMDDDLARFVLWPEQYPLYDLMLRMMTIGIASFGSEQQNNPHNPEMLYWPEEVFSEADRPEFRFKSWDDLQLAGRVMYLDPAKGTKSKPGDYACYILFGWDSKGREYVEADLFRGSEQATLDAIIRRGVSHVRDFKPDVFAYEAAFSQNLYGRLLAEAFERDHLRVNLWPMEDRSDKDVRIIRLDAPLCQRVMSFRKTLGTEMLLDQLRQYPLHERRDGPDALEGARRTGLELITLRRNKGANTPLQFRI